MRSSDDYVFGAARMIAVATIGTVLWAGAAEARAITEDIPIPGGRVALAHAIGIDTPPERGEFVAEVLRFVLARTNADNQRTAMVRRLVEYFASVRSENGEQRGSAAELVPMPLSPGLWGEAVFRRPVSASTLFESVLFDPNASLLARGLSALDDQTLQYFSEHPGLITRVYEHGAAPFSAFAPHLHIRHGRVVPPGGDRAASLWEAVLEERTGDPERFVGALYGNNDGRLAYLYDTIGNLDPGRAAFALGLWIEDATTRVDQFRVLADVARSGFHEWPVRTYYFKRPVNDLVALFMRVGVDGTGRPLFPASRVLWQRAFDGAGRVDDGPIQIGDLQNGSPIAAGWLARAIIGAQRAAREDRLDQVAFAAGAFDADASSLPEVLRVIQALPRFRMLILTLKSMGVRRASVYASLVHHAESLSHLDKLRGATALAEFQGAIALIARLLSVESIDRATAEMLLADLAAVPLTEGQYAGGVADWVAVHLRPVLPPAVTVEESLVSALAGPPGRIPARPLTWEGEQYTFDPATSEFQRLRRLRQYQGAPSLDTALDNLAQLRRAGAAGTTTTPSARTLFESVDVVLGQALVSIAYAVALNLPRDAERLATSIARRHDFGFGRTTADERVRAAWARPVQMTDEGVPWHVDGSILGLDVAFGSLALRRVAESLPRAPMLNSNQQYSFTSTLALMNPFGLKDEAQQALVEAVRRGERRVQELTSGNAEPGSTADEIAMDGWRRRAVAWTIAHDPARIRSYFSIVELLYLGGGGGLDLNAFGMSAIATRACFCTELLAPGIWTALVGRPDAALLGSTIPDLNLRIVLVLHDMRLPAALAKSVLAFAVSDFFDRTRPSDADNWLTLVRDAQGVTREQIEDYIAAAAADGALLAGGVVTPGRVP